MNQFEQIEEDMTDAGKAVKQVKGGVFAPTDIKLIKDALVFYVRHNGSITEQEESQAVSLMHRLNNRI